jgi:archaellum biogenesis protein FlaJ (TadC family)
MPNTRGDNTQVITPYGIIILIITFVATCANTLLIFKSKHKINLFYFGILEILFFILFITTTIGIYSNPRLFLPSYAEYIYEGPNE